MNESPRKVYLDILRIVAIFLVVFNHTPAFHFPFFTFEEHIGTKLMRIISAFDKVAVPLFLMISGALLLPKHETISTLLKKRVCRFVIVLLLFQVMQAVYYSVACGENGIGIRSFLSDCYWGSIEKGFVLGWAGAGTVWYFYVYIGVLLMLPFLRNMVKGMETVHFHYLFAIQMVFFVLCPALFVMITGVSPEDFALIKYLPLCSNIFIYVFAGYYAEHVVKVETLRKKHFIWLVTAAAMFIILASMMPEWTQIRMFGSRVKQYVPGVWPYLVVPCITLYLIVKKFVTSFSLSGRVTSVLQSLGGAVFTVMLVENILRQQLGTFFSAYETTYLPSILVSCLVCVIGLLLGVICKKIPVLRKLL